MGNYIPRQANLNNMAFNYFQRGEDWVEGANCLEQSPIDIIPEESEPNDKDMKMELFLTDHDLMGLKVLDTGNSLQVNGPFSKLLATDVEGDAYEYEALQFHFHAPAEHSICGGHYDLEMHIVHKITPRCVKKGGVKRDLAVVGIFFEVDEDPDAKPHPFLEALMLHDLNSDVSLNMNELFKKDLQNYETYYAYKGSLTVPPCSANANWYVIEKPLMITKHQLEQFDLRWKDNPEYAGGHGNNRPVQPLNGRVVMQSKNCCIMSRSQESVRQFLLEEKLLGSPLVTKLQIDRDLVFEALSLDQSHAMDHIHGFVDGHSAKHPDPHDHHLTNQVDQHGGH